MARKIVMVAMCAAAASASGQLVALSEVQFDLNSVTAQARDAAGDHAAFGGVMHTGSIVFGLDSDSFLQAYVDGSGLASLSRGGPFGDFTLSGVVELVNGAVTGGSFHIAIDGGADSYSASVEGGGGRVRRVADIQGGSFQIDGLAMDGLFSDSAYGNMDVSAFMMLQTFTGRFINFGYRPDANGFDGATDIDLFVNVPAPGGLAIVGIAAVASATRRRR